MSYQNIESAIRNMMTKKEQNQNLYDRETRADDTAWNRKMQERQMSNAEKQQQLANDQAAADQEMDWTDWTKLGVSALGTILGVPTGGTSTIGSSLINMLFDAGKKPKVN